MHKRLAIKIESELAAIYETGAIKAPIHLSKGNEKKLGEIFKDYAKCDWIFSTHRSHYHWLYSGRDPEKLKEQVVNGHSMHLYDEGFFTSAIVGGNASIALGVALALKLKKEHEIRHVWCFVGDAAYECGVVQESIKYAGGHDLPITYVVENDGCCVRACTKDVWGNSTRDKRRGKLKKYCYCRPYPHAGTGKYVMF